MQEIVQTKLALVESECVRMAEIELVKLEECHVRQYDASILLEILQRSCTFEYSAYECICR